MPRRSTATAGLLLLVVGGVLGFGIERLVAGPAPAEEAGDEVLLPPEEMQVDVAVEVASSGELPLVAQAAGVVRADPGGELSVASRASGRILAVQVAPGGTVRRGDTLLSIDPRPLAAARAEAQARAERAHAEQAAFLASGRETRRADLQTALVRAQAELELADAALERTSGLFEDGLASQRALVEARQARTLAAGDEETAQRALDAYDASQADLEGALLAAEVEAADAALADAVAVLDEAEVRAPADGQVVAVDVVPGAWHEAGAEVARLVVAGNRVVAFAVPQADAARIAAGARAWWTDSAGIRRQGSVSRVSDQVANGLGLIEVVAVPDPDQPQGPLPIGVSVRGELQVGTVQDAVLVPERAVLRNDDKRVVVVAGADDLARVVDVELLGLHGGLAAVAGDVSAGDRVIVEGGYNLPDGAHVVVRTAGESGGDGS